jgi:hypothetical protein
LGKIQIAATNIADRARLRLSKPAFFSTSNWEDLVMNAHRRLGIVVALLAVASFSSRTLAADEEAFYKASYLQSEERDFAAAAKLFEEVAASDEAPREIRQAAKRRLAECREEVAAADLAGLMPADSILYVQVANVGEQAKTILESLGVVNENGATAQSADRLPIEPGLSIPVDFAVSPALVREISKLGGFAGAITGFDERGVPRGVAALHLGGSDLVRGLVETGLQVVTPNEAIGDYPTYLIPAEGQHFWMVKTERLVIFSHSREEVAAAVGRISPDSQASSLKDSESFRNAAEARGETLVFAWADSQRAAPMIDAIMAREMHGEELIAARTVLNLQSIECATLALGATDGGIRGEAALQFKPGHQHLLYALIRTAPIGEDALKHVPADAAIVAAIGLNPPTERGDSEKPAEAPQLALIDIGRELFANVRSLSAFVAPGKTGIPEVGLVVQAQDGKKSKELWTRLMSLPAQFGALPASSVKDTEIRGHAVTQYSYPDAPQVFVVQPSDVSLVVGTSGAVEASLKALDEGVSLATHEDGAGLIERTSPATSKAVFLRGGQLLKCAEPKMGEHERRKAAAMAPLLEELTASLTLDEEANEVRLCVDVAGLPKVGEVLRAVGGKRAEAQQAVKLEAAIAP